MSYRTSTIALGLVVGTGIAAAAFAQSARSPTMAIRLPGHGNYRSIPIPAT